MAERDPRYFKVYQDGDDRELEQKIQQIVESGAAPGIDTIAREGVEEIQRMIENGEIGGGGGGAGIDPKAREDIQKVTTELAGTVKEVNGVKPTNGKVTLPIPEVDTTNLATKNDLDGTHLRIDELIIESGDANAEVTDAHVSTAKNKTFTTVRNRLEEIEAETFFSATNRLLNADFSKDSNNNGLADDWTNGSNITSFSLANNVQTFGAKGLTAWANSFQQLDVLTLNRKYFVSIEAKVDRAVSDTNFRVKSGYSNDIINVNLTTEFKRYFATYTVVEAPDYQHLSLFGANGLQVSIRRPLVIDLTEVFGAGNEPSTEEVNDLLGRFPDRWFNQTANMWHSKNLTTMFLSGMGANKLGRMVSYLCFDGNKVNFDFTNKQIVIPYDTNIVYGNNRYTVPVRTVVEMPAGRDLIMLYFNTVSKTFICRDAGNVSESSKNELLMAIGSINQRTVSSIGSYVIDGKSSSEETQNMHQNSFDDVIRVSAHRGYNNSVPENTLPSFTRAKKEGFVYIEFDVRFTSDNVAVLLHDPTLNRTARNVNGSTLATTINIADITYEQALTYDFGIFKGSSFAGTKIPTLEETFELCRMLNLRPYIHVNVANDTQLAHIFSLVKKYGLKRKSVWIMNGLERSRAVLNLDHKAIVGVAEAPTEQIIDSIVALKEEFDNDNITIDVYKTDMTDNLAEYCHEKGLEFGVFTANETEVILDSVRKGAVSLTVDNINVKKLLEENYSSF